MKTSVFRRSVRHMLHQKIGIECLSYSIRFINGAVIIRPRLNWYAQRQVVDLNRIANQIVTIICDKGRTQKIEIKYLKSGLRISLRTSQMRKLFRGDPPLEGEHF